MASTYFCSSIKERFKNLQDEMVNDGKVKILRSTLKGTKGIMAVEGLTEDYKAVVVVFYSKIGEHEVWEKVMDESVGPAFYDIPQVYLDLTECDGKSEIATEWRKKVVEVNEFKKELKDFVIPTGAYIEYYDNRLVYTGYGRTFRDIGGIYREGRLVDANAKQFQEIKAMVLHRIKNDESIEVPKPTAVVNGLEIIDDGALFTVEYDDNLPFNVHLTKEDGRYNATRYSVARIDWAGVELRMDNLYRLDKAIEDAIKGVIDELNAKELKAFTNNHLNNQQAGV